MTFSLTRCKPKFRNYGTLPVLHIASAQNDSKEFIQAKNLKIVYLLTQRVMVGELHYNTVEFF